MTTSPQGIDKVVLGQTPSQQGLIVQHSSDVKPPMGIEFLVPLTGVFVKQDIQLLGLALKDDMNNKYSVFNESGQLIYRAQENSDYWSIACPCTCGTSRPFTILMFDVNNSCITYESHRVSGMCQEVTCIDPAGQVLGYVSQIESGCYGAKFEIQDAMRVPCFTVSNSQCQPNGCCGRVYDIPMPVITMDGHTVGEICKKWAGYAQEYRTKADNFLITFPLDLDAKLKAVLIGACFQMDYMFYENIPQSGMVKLPAGIDLQMASEARHIELMEAILHTEMNNKYSLYNSAGKLIYRAQENSDYWKLNWSMNWATSRPFTFFMFDANNACITFESNAASGLCQEVTCSDPAGQMLGYVSQTESGCCDARFEIQDAARKSFFTVPSPGVGFVGVKSVSPVGEICKQWSGFMKESYVDADNLVILVMVTLSVDLDARLKDILNFNRGLLSNCFCFFRIYVFRNETETEKKSSSS